MKLTIPTGGTMTRLTKILGCPVTLFLFSSLALGHVTVMPRESAAGAEVRYSARVPTETASPTVSVEVRFPEGLRVSEFEANPGWTAVFQRDAAGTIVSVAIDGGSIPPRESSEFSFLARNPSEAAELVWEIRQVYADGNSSDWTPATAVTNGN